MAQRDDTSPESFLHSLVSPEEMRQAAFRLGVVKRVRKVEPVAFLVSTVLTVCGRGKQTIGAMRRSFAKQSGTLMVRSSFWDRFTLSFEALVLWLLIKLQRKAAEAPPTYTGILKGFSDVVAVDSTVIKVADCLAGVWAGTRYSTMAAALKVHTWIRAVTGELLAHRITPEAYADCRAFRGGPVVRNVLFLFDRGYNSAPIWWSLDQAGGFFLTRLKSSFRPTVVSTNPAHGGRQKIVGKLLPQVLKHSAGVTIDVVCRFSVRIPAPERPEKCPAAFTHDFRVVGLWDIHQERHHVYVTNVPPERLPPSAVWPCYRLRWEIETFFKTGKGGLGLAEVASTKPHIVRTLVRGALIRDTITMQAKAQAEANLPNGRWINAFQWVTVWREHLDALLRGFARGCLTGCRLTWKFLAQLAQDPNVKRVPTRIQAVRQDALKYYEQSLQQAVPTR